MQHTWTRLGSSQHEGKNRDVLEENCRVALAATIARDLAYDRTHRQGLMGA